ncbi:DUF4062 domain-containing protein [Brevibacillus nitrificans]|uniref:DUF4062 domain-containing protein n=1 Tax=Brevibacillus nitrificans TaxID=651560 RepID=A0A3M8CV63_9BACL|nr:DUF4062 domain-containing protein [Brevibacillus nitrificans]RNB78735.1 DUF4062 domain-containing protein [Brevibacillus nitrificans]
MKCKIFISSVGQDSLVPLRDSMFETLTGLGHEPIMYEKPGFGLALPGESSVEQCLRLVNESHIYLLFISTAAGSYLKDANRTVTHLEYIQAWTSQKYMQIFVEKTVLQYYFQKVRSQINEYVASYEQINGTLPDCGDVYRHVEDLQHKGFLQPLVPTDPYIWALLHEIIDIHKVMVQEIALGVPKDWGNMFSDILRQGVVLIPRREQSEENERLASSYQDFTDVISSVMNKLSIREITDQRGFLSEIRSSLKGGEIKQVLGNYATIPQGDFRDCSAVVLFKRSQDSIICEEADGRTSISPGASFDLSNQDSFVAVTYHLASPDPVLFYKESKQTFYLTLKVGEYIISFHFPADRTWSIQKFKSCESFIYDGIMSVHGNALTIRYVKSVLRGLQS